MSLRWRLYDEDFAIDVFDPLNDIDEEEEEIICTSSGRGRLFQHSIPRIPLKLLKLINTAQSFEENDYIPVTKPLPAMPAHLSETTRNRKPVPVMPTHLSETTHSGKPLPAMPSHLSGSRQTVTNDPLPVKSTHLESTERSRVPLTVPDLHPTEDSQPMQPSSNMYAQMSGVRNETSVRSRGRGRAQRLKHHLQNREDETSKKNVVPIRPFGVSNPKPRILRPEEMFIKRDDIKGLHLASDDYFRSLSGPPPPSKDMHNFEAEFPSLSSSDEQQVKHKELRNNLDKLSPGKKQQIKNNAFQMPKETSKSLKNLATSSMFTNSNPSRSTDMCIGTSDLSCEVIYNVQEAEFNVNNSSEPVNLRSDSSGYKPSSSSTTLSPNQSVSTSLSSSINDIYYSSLTSTDEKEENVDGYKLCPQSSTLSPLKSVDEHSEQWSLSGDNVIQLDGLPLGCDVFHIEELVATFGTVEDSEVMFKNTTSSLRFRLDTSDACDWVVSCLHDTDSIYPEFNCVLSCFRVM